MVYEYIYGIIKKTSQPDGSPKVDAKVLDSATIVQKINPRPARTFQEYAEERFLPYIIRGGNGLQKFKSPPLP